MDINFEFRQKKYRVIHVDSEGEKTTAGKMLKILKLKRFFRHFPHCEQK